MGEPNLPVPPELARLSTFIDSSIECLAGSSSELRSIALNATKHIFDWALETERSSNPHLGTLLATLTETAPPQTRSRARGTTTQGRSLSPMPKPPRKFDIGQTPLSSLFVEVMNSDQLWQQLDLRAARVCENLEALQGDDVDENEEPILAREDSDVDESDNESDAAEMDIDSAEHVWVELSGEEDGDSSTAEDVNLQEESPDDEQDHVSPGSMSNVGRSQRKLQGHPDLDDGFFDLAAFNAEINEADVNNTPKRKLDFGADSDSAEESEVDLFGLVDDSGTGVVDGRGLFYNDFFEPPPRIQNKTIRSSKVRFHDRVAVKKIRLVGRGMPVSSIGDEESDEEEETDSSDGSN